MQAAVLGRSPGSDSSCAVSGLFSPGVFPMLSPGGRCVRLCQWTLAVSIRAQGQRVKEPKARCRGGAAASPGPAQEPAAEQPDGGGGSVPEGRASPGRRNACERSHLFLPEPKEMFAGIEKGQNARAGPSTPNGRVSLGWIRMLPMLLRN